MTTQVSVVPVIWDAVKILSSLIEAYPSDPSLPLFVAPKKNLTTGRTVPASAVKKDGTMDLSDPSWWPVV